MATRTAAFGVVLCALASSTASAAILVFTDQTVYTTNTSSYATSGEDFGSFADTASTPSLSGSAGGVSWTGSSAGGVRVVSATLGSATATTLTVSFSASGGVYGVSGNFWGTDAGSVIQPSFVTVRLNDGTTYLNYITSPSFVGFVSTGAAISSIDIEARNGVGAGATWYYANVDNMSFAYVPAPGAFALLGLAGLAGSRRRR